MHRNALAAINEQELNMAESAEQMHTTTRTIKINDTVHVIKEELTLHHGHEVAVWGYLMTQYNLKPGFESLEKVEPRQQYQNQHSYM